MRQFKNLDLSLSKNKPKSINSWLQHKFNDILNEPTLLEGLTRSYPIDFVIDKMKYHFGFTDNDIMASDNGKTILLMIPFSEENKSIAEENFDYFGYFLSTYDKKENGYMIMQFEPKFEPSCDEEVRKIGILYHATPYYNMKDILENGFSPRCKNDVFTYPSRVYFMSGFLNQEQLYQNANSLSKHNLSKGNNGRYIIFKIDVSKIKNGIHFYKDVNANFAYYITDNLASDCIIGHEEITCETPFKNENEIYEYQKKMGIIK